MKEQLKEKGLALRAQAEELKQLWMEYVKQQGEVDLKAFYLTMWDGAGERMDRLVYHDDDVFVRDVYGNEYRFADDIGFQTLDNLHDFLFVKKPYDEE